MEDSIESSNKECSPGFLANFAVDINGAPTKDFIGGDPSFLTDALNQHVEKKKMMISGGIMISNTNNPAVRNIYEPLRFPTDSISQNYENHDIHNYGTGSTLENCFRYQSVLQEPPGFSRSISVRLVENCNGFHLVPVSSFDASLLVEQACQLRSPKLLPIVLHPGFIQVVDPPAPYTVAAGSMNYALPVQVTQPKHIYRTSSETYRVQVGKGSKTERNGKFSRNAQTESDALWLCEIALVIIDCPATLDDAIRCGNYKCMLQRGMVSSPQDFAVKLVEEAEQLKIRFLLRPDECEQAVAAFHKLIPPAILSTIAAENSLFDSSLNSQSQGNSGDNVAPKKRRRTAKSSQFTNTVLPSDVLGPV